MTFKNYMRRLNKKIRVRRGPKRTQEFDGPFEVEWTRFGFIWGPIHVERTGDSEQGRIGVYVTNGDRASVHYTVDEDGSHPSYEVFRDWEVSS